MDSNLPSATWRLILDAPAPGVRNMAVDEAILQAVMAGEAPPTLRLYAWQPACLSLGYGQPISDVDQEALAARGWELVRRPTGGRAILHSDELTYSVIGPADEPRLVGGVLESYQRLSQGLLRALEILAVPAQRTRGRQATNSNTPDPVCFVEPSDFEITVNGKKLVGSAQARRKTGVLQHGTLPLYGDIARITHALRFEDEVQRTQAAERVRQRAATVEEALGRVVPWEEAAAALQQGFAQALGLNFEPGELSVGEEAHAQHWAQQQYAHEAWTLRV